MEHAKYDILSTAGYVSLHLSLFLLAFTVLQVIALSTWHALTSV